MMPLSAFQHFMLFGILCGLIASSEGYTPIVFMHGILAGPEEFDYFNSLIQQYHPGTKVIAVNMFNKLESLENIWSQVLNISKVVEPVLTHPDGAILICYSQGGLICRGLLSVMKHNVQTFIGLSSPLAGQFGDSAYLKFLFPRFLKEHIYKFFYTTVGQKISIANYWNDPHQQPLFDKFSTYLALLNNQSSVVNPRSHEFRENFLRLKNVVLVGGPDDEVITPWQSSHFGMYNASEVVLPMEEQEWFQNDAFGLKTLKSRGSIHMKTVPGIKHAEWHKEVKIYETCIKPWLT